MAKKQTFGDKTGKQSTKKGIHIKVIRAFKTGKGSLSFKNEICLTGVGFTLLNIAV